MLSAPQVGHGVSVVGVVRRSAHYDTNVQYCVDDMTGPPLLVKQWRRPYPKPVKLPPQATPICPGTYVKVTGCLRGGSVLLALNVRCLQELNEITSHMMEVVQAHMQLFGKVPEDAAGLPQLDRPQVRVRRFAEVKGRPRASRTFGLSLCRTSLAFLLNEGHIFSTVDQHHFKSTEH
uniref:Replication protein A 32 kDa subunit-like n=1 Tax=Takifugu rubripes TaxID=31033 RepID=A0A674PJJ7_TAKRU